MKNIEQRNCLVLPRGVEVTSVGLNISAALSFEQWFEVGKNLQAIHRSVLFWLGDWLRFGEQRYGQKFSQAIEVTGYAAQTLMNAQWVASRIENSRRTGELSFSHHMEVAALEADQQDRFLKAAFDNEWSTRELREAIKTAKGLPSKASSAANEKTSSAVDGVHLTRTTQTTATSVSVETISRSAIEFLDHELQGASEAEIATVLRAIVAAFSGRIGSSVQAVPYIDTNGNLQHAVSIEDAWREIKTEHARNRVHA